jgi:hypothetical protein
MTVVGANRVEARARCLREEQFGGVLSQATVLVRE